MTGSTAASDALLPATRRRAYREGVATTREEQLIAARNHNLRLSDLARHIADGTSTATELLAGPRQATADDRGLESA
jgi:hypothetical protein